MITLSGHQPCYLPSLQLFAKMNKSDVFMHCGHLQFRAGSWHHRNYIRLYGRKHLLGIPIQKPHIKPIRDAWFADQKWKERHLKAMALEYHDAPFFGDYYPTIRDILYSRFHPHSLEQLNIDLTNTIAKWLDIETLMTDSANWHFEGDAVSMIIQMCHAINADRYLSNMGAMAYLTPIEEERMADAGVSHDWIDFKDPDEHPLSVVHHLFTIGPEAVKRLIQ